MSNILGLRHVQFALLATALLLSVCIGRSFMVEVSFYAITIVVVCCLLSIWRRKGVLVGFILLFALVGLQRGYETAPVFHPLSRHVGQSVELSGVVVTDPQFNEKSRTEFVLGNAVLAGQPVPGSVKVQTSYKQLTRGQRAKVSGKIYESLGSSAYHIGFGAVEVTDERISVLEQVRQRFFAAVYTNVPEPYAGFILGILVGTRGLLEESLADQLKLIGLTHIIAVSGYNLTIIVQAVQRLLGRYGIAVATFSSSWLIGGFLLITGFSASIVRASLVAGLALFTNFYGYRVHPLTLISLPAIATVLVNPDYLLRDVGWQLSFLAFFGILIFAPLIQSQLPGHDRVITAIVVQSMCAYIMTAPLLIYIFGSISVLAPLANMLVTPLIPLAMMLGFIAGIVSMVLPVVGAWFSLPATGLVGITLAICSWLSSYDQAKELSLTLEMAILLYGVIMLITLALWRRSRRRGNFKPADTLRDRLYG